MSRAWVVSLAMLVGFTPPIARGADPDKGQPVRVTVVVIYATTRNNVVDKKLTALAKEMEHRYPDLIGFQLGPVLQKTIAVGGSYEFPMPGRQKLTVAVDKPRDKSDRITLTLTTPGGKVVSYSCVCGKFFPIVTEQQTPCGRTLMTAVGAKPCTGKGP